MVHLAGLCPTKTLQGVERHYPCDPEGSALGGCPYPHKTLYNRFRRWPDKGFFDLIFSELSASNPAEPFGTTESEILIIDATDLKAHPTASSLNRGVPAT